MTVWRDIGWAGASMAGARVLGFATLIVLARGLSPVEFGHYIVFLAVAIVAIPVVDAGCFALVARVAARSSVPPFTFAAEADRIRAPVWAIALGIPTIAVVAGASWGAALTAGVIGAVAQAQMDAMAGELEANGNFARAGAIRLSTSIIGLGGALLIVVVGPSATSAMLSFAFARLVPVVLFRCAARRRTSYARVPSGLLTLRAALPFALTAGLTVAYVRSDVIVMGALGVHASAIGGYGAAYNALVALQLVASAVLATAYPRISQADANDAPRLIALAFWGSLTITACAIAVVLTHPVLVMRLFGPTYTEMGELLRPLFAVAISISIGQVMLASLQARNAERDVLKVVVAAFALNVGLNLMLIPTFGLRGAIVATLLAETFVALACAYVLSRRHIADLRVATVAAVAWTPLAFIDARSPVVAGVAVSVIAVWGLTTRRTSNMLPWRSAAPAGRREPAATHLAVSTEPDANAGGVGTGT